MPERWQNTDWNTTSLHSHFLQVERADSGADKLPDIPALELLCSQSAPPQPRPGVPSVGAQNKDLPIEIPLIPASCSCSHSLSWPAVCQPGPHLKLMLHLNIALRAGWWTLSTRCNPGPPHQAHSYLSESIFIWCGVRCEVWGVQVQLCWAAHYTGVQAVVTRS